MRNGRTTDDVPKRRRYLAPALICSLGAAIHLLILAELEPRVPGTVDVMGFALSVYWIFVFPFVLWFNFTGASIPVRSFSVAFAVALGITITTVAIGWLAIFAIGWVMMR